MSGQFKLEAKIEMEGPLRIGDHPKPPNKFDLSITNRGEPLELSRKKCLRLRGRLGSDAEALFVNDTDARECRISKPQALCVEWSFPEEDKSQFILKIWLIKTFEKNQTVRISFIDVISKTSPDESAVLFLEGGPSGATQDLFIKKAGTEPGIISFTSEPPEGTQNLPGDSVTLKWNTYGLVKRTLTQIGIAAPLACDLKEIGEKRVQCETVDIAFRLRGYDKSRPIELELSVKVLRPGWHSTTHTILPRDVGYPVTETEEETSGTEELILEPTLLFNANNKLLYGIFRHQYEGKERALLFKTENPFGGWRFVESSVSGQDGFIPEGFATSPGIYFDDKLWLMGGSQIDPDKTARGVWRFDPKEGKWEDWGDAAWSPRMGHAVLEFKNMIWVIGGCGEAGNALNDVWALDIDKEREEINKEWVKVGNAPWEPRCLISPVVFDNRIWLYGGAKAPDSAKLFYDLFTCSYDNEQKAEWKKQEITGIIEGSELRKPIASCLQEFNERLHLFGKFRTVSPSGDESRLDEPLGFCLTCPSTRTWERFPAEGLETWGAQGTCSYQAVNFDNRMLVAKALGKEMADSPVLKVYVPG